MEDLDGPATEVEPGPVGDAPVRRGRPALLEFQPLGRSPGPFRHRDGNSGGSLSEGSAGVVLGHHDRAAPGKAGDA